MSKNLYRGLNTPEHNPNRNGFDRSQKHLFTAQVGQLIPLSPIETVPHSHYKIDISSLVRTLPLNTAAFLRCKINYDVYFVPYTQLYHNFNQFIGQSTDTNSASLNHVAAYAPNFDIWNFVSNYTSTATPQDVHGLNAQGGSQRLLDMLGYGRYLMGVTKPTLSAYPKPNLFRALAYQKIWYDFYRNPYYDNTLTSSLNYAEIFNVDDIQSSDMEVTNQNRLRYIFRLNYVQWKKDLIMGLLPSTQFGSVTSILPSNVLITNSYSSIVATDNVAINANNKQMLLRDSSNNIKSGSNSWNIVGVSSLGSTNTNVLDFRRNIAIQKWREYRLRAGNRSDNIQKAFFGVKPRYDMDNHPQFLGSFQNDLNIDEVVSTTNNGPYVSEQSAPLGAIGGKGIAVVNDKTIDFDCNDYGIIMPVCYIRPESEYSSLGLDRENQLIEPTDFYTPAYENLGLESVPYSVLKNAWQPSVNNTVIGYAPRYYEYKTALDKVHNHFNYHWGLINTETDFGSLTYWVPSRTDLTLLGNSSFTLSMLYVNPTIMNEVFVGQVDSNADDSADQFMLNTYVRCHCVQPMSKLGLPTL